MSESKAARQVTNAVSELKEILRHARTEDIVGQCILNNLAATNQKEPKHHLSSPAKQQAFLLNLLLATPIPYVRRPLGDGDWERVYRLLQDAFTAYMELYWPKPEEMGSVSPQWHRVRHVAMSAFMHYFNTGLLATVDQIRDRIERYIVPFDAVLQEKWGISSSAALEVADSIQERLADNSIALADVTQELKDVQARAEALAEDRGQPPSAAPRIAVEELDIEHLAERFQRETNMMSAVAPSALVNEFGEAGEAYINHFFTRRGRLPEITYPTEEYAWEAKAGIHCGQDRVLLPSVNGLYTSLLTAAERALDVSEEVREAWFRHRDTALEEEVAEIFHRLLGRAQHFTNVFETADQQFEHDLVVVDRGVVFIVEIKASPPVEPFRDPDKAFQRLRHAFRSDSGIQYGFEQAARIRRRLDSGEEVVLYDSSGEEAVTLEPSELQHRICVCVTRDDFGVLATNLELLLEKEDSEPFPWVLNVLELDSLESAWTYLDWGEEELLRYLKWRLHCHGKVVGTDELEYVGYHIRHGSLQSAVQAEADLMQLNPGYSDFFDELYYHQHLDGPPPERDVVDPVVMDLKRSLGTEEPVFVSRHKEPRRNDECPCGSGRKFKRCCGDLSRDSG